MTTISREPNPSPLLPPPLHSKKKLVILLTNAPRLEKSNRQTGFDIRDLAHMSEILFYYYSRSPSKDFPATPHPSKPSSGGPWTGNSGLPMTEPVMDWNWVKEHIVLASPRGGEAPLDAMVLPDAQKDILTKEFMGCTALMDMVRHTTKITEVHPDECLGVLICGGHGCLQDFPKSTELGAWLYKVYCSKGHHDGHPSGKEDQHHSRPVIAAVCHGTAALLAIPLASSVAPEDPNMAKPSTFLKDRTICCPSKEEERQLQTDKDVPFMLEDKLRELGAKIQNSDPFEINVIQDERIITAQNTQSVRSLTRAFIHTIYKEHHKHEDSTASACGYCP